MGGHGASREVVPVLSAAGLSGLTGQELVNTKVRILERGGERE